MFPMKTIKELAEKALAAQDACNLSGVVHSFSSAMTELREIAMAENWDDTEKLNRHPIAILYSSKIASLTYSEIGSEFSIAYNICKDIVEGK
jgi:hypothetical protein